MPAPHARCGKQDGTQQRRGALNKPKPKIKHVDKTKAGPPKKVVPPKVAPTSKLCSCCEKQVLKEKFANSQWVKKLDSERCCIVCVKKRLAADHGDVMGATLVTAVNGVLRPAAGVLEAGHVRGKGAEVDAESIMDFASKVTIGEEGVAKADLEPM
jgi:hypothetical protein